MQIHLEMSPPAIKQIPRTLVEDKPFSHHTSLTMPDNKRKRPSEGDKKDASKFPLYKEINYFCPPK